MTSANPSACFSQRFQREVCLTRHAEIRMRERGISAAMLLEVIDTGDTRYRDETHLWEFKSFPDRDDNLLCAVLVLEDRLIVKTVMHHFAVL
jgi:hypothetical protein